MAEQIVGRRRELVALGEFLEVLPEGGSALVFEGDAGIGKTALWQEGARLARERGFRALSARATQPELQSSFAAVADLFARRWTRRCRGWCRCSGVRWRSRSCSGSPTGRRRRHDCSRRRFSRSCGSSWRAVRSSSRSTMRSGSTRARRRSSASCSGGWRPSRSGCWRRCAGYRPRRRSSSAAPSRGSGGSPCRRSRSGRSTGSCGGGCR